MNKLSEAPNEVVCTDWNQVEPEVVTLFSTGKQNRYVAKTQKNHKNRTHHKRIAWNRVAKMRSPVPIGTESLHSSPPTKSIDGTLIDWLRFTFSQLVR